MPNNFDEASAATVDLFDNEQATLDEATVGNEETSELAAADLPDKETSDGNLQTEANQSEDESATSTIEQAAQTAETAAQLAKEKDIQLQEVLRELDTLKQQNQQLQGTIDEISSRNAENIVDEALQPPVLDINSLAFADEETQREAMERYAEQLSNYNRRQIMDEMSPAIEYAKQGMREREKTEVINALAQIPELANIKEDLPQLDRIIASNKWLNSDEMPIDEKYINAYALAKGVNSINNPPEPRREPTTDELMSIYNSNPEFREMIEKQRLDAIKQSQQVPPFSASQGAGNAALNIKSKPQTLEEASKRTREWFDKM